MGCQTPRVNIPKPARTQQWIPAALEVTASGSTSASNLRRRFQNSTRPNFADLDRVVDERLGAAIERTRGHLLALQHEEGYWLGELEGDTILESEYILLLAYLGRERATSPARRPPTSSKAAS